jgi:hypothetical protein
MDCPGQPTTAWMTSQTCGSGTVITEYNSYYFNLAQNTPIIWVYPPEQQTIYCKIRIPLNPGEVADSGCPANSPPGPPAPPAPATTVPPTCMKFDVNKYGAPKPVITSSASGSTITTTVTMLRQYENNAGSMTVFHNLDTKEAGANVCRTSDNLVSSVDSAWVRSTTSCTETYTLTQTLSDIVNTAGSNNNWVAVLENNGQDIKYTVPIYSTFSVNIPADVTCYYVGYVSYVSFRTQLNVASTSANFVTADGSAKWQFSGLRITPDSKLEISGQMTPLVPGGELRAIALSKRTGPISIPTSTTICTTYNVGCPQIYSVALTSLPTDLTDNYDNTMEVWEKDATNTFVKTRDVTLSYQLSYIIPSDPSVVDSDTIQTQTKLYTDNTYTTIRTASYSSLSAAADSLFIENVITATSPTIPSNYKLRLDRGYLCCVNYLAAISTYDPVTNPTGGCASSSGKLEWVDLGSESVHPTPSVVLTSSDSLGNKKFRVQVPMNTANAVNTAHAAPMTCQVLMISKLEAPAARRIGSASNLDSTYVATVPFVVEASIKVTASASIVSMSAVAAVIVVVNLLL